MSDVSFCFGQKLWMKTIGSIDYNKTVILDIQCHSFFSYAIAVKFSCHLSTKKIKESWKSLNFKTAKLCFHGRNCVMIERLEKSFINLTD